MDVRAANHLTENAFTSTGLRLLRLQIGLLASLFYEPVDGAVRMHSVQRKVRTAGVFLHKAKVFIDFQQLNKQLMHIDNS